MFDDEPVVSDMDHPEHGALRLPDGRALAWAEYGSPRGLPCLLLPDVGSSRLAPGWLLHDSALPSAVRLLALDRPGTGASDPVGLGGLSDPASDLARLVTTLAVGRVSVIGIGRGADDAFAFARRSPQLVASVSGVSVRLDADPPAPRRRFRRRPRPGGAVAAQWHASVSDLKDEAAWSAALPRLSPAARAALGERWRESDFRAAVAADLGVSSHHWNGVDDPGGTADWTDRRDVISAPTRLWHGQQESTPLADLRRITADHDRWQLSAVSGPTAALGYWPQIMAAAVDPFRPTLTG